MAEFARYPSLAGKVVFITGGASGIGEAFVEAFLEQGARVGFVDLQGAAGEALADRLGAWFQACDVTDVPALQTSLQACAAALGPVQILINNVANDTRAPAVEMSIADWRASLAINLDPAFAAAVAVQPAMKAEGAGAIINVSSINALVGPPNLVAYVAAKGAINALTKSLAREWGPFGLRVNALSPGWVVTQRQLDLWLTPQAEARWMEEVALQRRIAPSDVARAALFLASDESAMITGQNIVVDGGRT